MYKVELSRLDLRETATALIAAHERVDRMLVTRGRVHKRIKAMLDHQNITYHPNTNIKCAMVYVVVVSLVKLNTLRDNYQSLKITDKEIHTVVESLMDLLGIENVYTGTCNVADTVADNMISILNDDQSVYRDIANFCSIHNSLSKISVLDEKKKYVQDRERFVRRALKVLNDNVAEDYLALLRK